MTDINNKHKTYNVASQLTTSVNDFIFVSEYDINYHFMPTQKTALF